MPAAQLQPQNSGTTEDYAGQGRQVTASPGTPEQALGRPDTPHIMDPATTPHPKSSPATAEPAGEALQSIPEGRVHAAY